MALSRFNPRIVLVAMQIKVNVSRNTLRSEGTVGCVQPTDRVMHEANTYLSLAENRSGCVKLPLRWQPQIPVILGPGARPGGIESDYAHFQFVNFNDLTVVMPSFRIVLVWQVFANEL